MTFKCSNNILLIVMIILVSFSSCKKENSVTLVKTEEEIETQFRMDIRGLQIQTNAVAALCQNDTLEFLIISNKEEHLDFLTSPIMFEEGDFVYYKVVTDNYSYSVGRHALEEEITDLPGLIGSSEANIQIEYKGENIISGSSEGVLFAFDSLFQPTLLEPYTMEFDALIVQESNYCNQ